MHHTVGCRDALCCPRQPIIPSISRLPSSSAPIFLRILPTPPGPGSWRCWHTALKSNLHRPTRGETICVLIRHTNALLIYDEHSSAAESGRQAGRHAALGGSPTDINPVWPAVLITRMPHHEPWDKQAAINIPTTCDPRFWWRHSLVKIPWSAFATPVLRSCHTLL